MRPRPACFALALLSASCGRRAPAQVADAGSATPVAPASEGSGANAASEPDASRARAPIACTPDGTFPEAFDVPEASAAAEVELRRGVRELLVVSDSGEHGAALAFTLPDGPARRLRLPLDARVSDDVEGIAWRAGHLYSLVSAGFVQRFTPDAKGELVRDGDAYALGAPPYASSHSDRAWGEPPDYEGLCLRASPPSSATSPSPPPRCAGYAASRAYGWLVCLVIDEHGRLRVDPDHPRLALRVPQRTLSDCAFGAAGGPAESTLLVSTNVYGGSQVSRVDERTGALFGIDVPTTTNDEAIAVDHEGRLYQLMDGDAARSPALRATCTGW